MHEATRTEALQRLEAALAATRIAGVHTNLDFQRSLLADPAFVVSGVDTGFLASRSGNV